MLKKILIGNVLSLAKSLDVFIEKKICTKINVKETSVVLKNVKHIAFEGTVHLNVMLPNYIGIGKSVSKGFGTITI